MPFFIVLPFIIIGVVVFYARNAAEQKKRAEQAKRQAERIPWEKPQTRPSATVPRPTVQTPAPARSSVPTTIPTPAAAPVRTPPIQKTNRSPFSQPTQQKHPEHDLCALRPEDPKPQEPLQPQTCAAQQTNGGLLNFTPDRILNGVIFSEIFGKPKALR